MALVLIYLIQKLTGHTAIKTIVFLEFLPTFELVLSLTTTLPYIKTAWNLKKAIVQLNKPGMYL